MAARLAAVLDSVADGNGLAFLDLVDGTARRPASLEALRNAVAAAGGDVREFKAPNREGMARWISDRAVERGIRITGPAAALLAERVGANVRERDVDRRRQGEMAVSELEKLAIYRLDGQIVPEDVKALVADAVPGSTWAFLDAVGMRRAAEAAELADRLDDVPSPVLVVHLHRRLRELIQIADLLAAGTPAAALVRTLKLNPYRAEMLANQARTWTLPELDAALAGLLELDSTLKGRDGGGELRRRSAVVSGSPNASASRNRARFGASLRRRKLEGTDERADLSRRWTRPAPGRPDRSRWRTRSFPGPDRAARSIRGRCRAGGSLRRGRPGCRSKGVRSGRAVGT
jgi:hypothetical protein